MTQYSRLPASDQPEREEQEEQNEGLSVIADQNAEPTGPSSVDDNDNTHIDPYEWPVSHRVCAL